MGTFRRSALIVLAVAGIPACSLLVTTSDLTSGASSGATDGGTDGSGQAIDADALVSSEAGAEGGSASDATGPFCASLVPAPAYCADFDDGTFTLTGDGETFLEPGQATIGLDLNRSVSGNGSLLAVTTKGEDPYPESYAFQPIGPANRFRIEADIFIEQTEGEGGTRVLGLQAGANDSTIVMIAVQPDGSVNVSEEWREGTAKKRDYRKNYAAAVVNTWFHATMSLDLTTRALTATVNGLDIAGSAPLVGPIVPGDAGGIFGLYYPNVVGKGWSARFDNVVIDRF